MNTINLHHFTAIRTSIDAYHIAGLLVKVIETHITNSETCRVAYSAIMNLFEEPSMKCELNQFHPFHSNPLTC